LYGVNGGFKASISLRGRTPVKIKAKIISVLDKAVSFPKV